MKNVITRSISGILYVGLLVGAVLAGGAWLVVLLCLLAVTGMYEFINMTTTGKFPRVSSIVDMACGVMLIITSWFATMENLPTTKHCAVAFLVLMIARFIGQLYSRGNNNISSIGNSMASLLYVAFPLALVPVLYNLLANPQIFLALLIFIWINDTGAFCVGTLFGKHRLFERISPKKSWEGFFGGLIFCVITGFIMAKYFDNYYEGMTIWQMCRLGIFVSIFATYGDLIESQIKRSVGVKDSSHLIPGHGGILDRIDSLLLVIPVAVIYFIVL